MINLNKYINETWNGVKKYTNNAEMESWCEEMGIEDYTINSKGEIDVDSDVDLSRRDFKELLYKFGVVKGYFSVYSCENLTSLKNCPYFVGDLFDVDNCSKLDSLEGCPKEVKGNFCCGNCERKFTKEEVQRYCNVKKRIYL